MWPGVRRLVEGQARRDAGVLARGLMGILEEQVAMMGSDAYNNSRKAVQIFGNVGQSKDVLQPVMSDLPISSRERIRPHSLPGLAIGQAKNGAVNALLAVLGAIIHLAQAFAKVASAHHVLMLVLAASALVNVYFTHKDSWAWYRERQAKAFMKGVGVRPMSTGLGHSIWLRDLDQLSLPGSSGIQPITLDDSMMSETVNGTETSQCRQNFNALLAQTDPSSPPLSPSSSTSSTTDSDSKILGRLQRSRYTFGTYRHDLLVALKVVERVERETISAEWEGWVRSEVGRCRATRKMLSAEEGGSKGVREWWDRYCGSCEGEAKSIG